MASTRKTRIRELVRNFKENGMKMLLEHPANVRDVLRLADVPWFEQIGFDQLEQIKTTFIRRNYRHLQSDIVLTAPLAGPDRLRKKLHFGGCDRTGRRVPRSDADRRAADLREGMLECWGDGMME